jgi:hypothetical protein
MKEGKSRGAAHKVSGVPYDDYLAAYFVRGS